MPVETEAGKAPSHQELLTQNITSSFVNDCVPSSPSSTINCSESGLPTVQFNKIVDGEKLFGHDGKGVVFADSDKLVKDNPQLKTAERGDRLNFSFAIDTERYFDDGATQPIIRYSLTGLYSYGLTPDASSFVVKVDGQTLPTDAYTLDLREADGQDAEMISARHTFSVTIDWADYANSAVQGYTFNSFKYDENATIELLFAGTVDSDATGKVYGSAAYGIDYLEGNSKKTLDDSYMDVMSGKYRATALLDGNLVIRRVDADGNPLPGARYAIDGISAKQGAHDNELDYDKNGTISEFITDKDGRVIIKNVPLGEYVIKEISSPEGHIPENSTMPVTVSWENSDQFSYEVKKYTLQGIDVTDAMQDLGDNLFYLKMGGFGEESDLYYDAESGTYKSESDSSSFSGAKISFDSARNAYVLGFGDSDEAFVFEYNEKTGEYRKDTLVSDTMTAEGSDTHYKMDFDYIVFNDDGTIKVALTDDQSYLFGNRHEDGCYDYIGELGADMPEDAVQSAIKLCEEADGGYTMALDSGSDVPSGSSDVPGMGAHFVYNEKIDKWVFDYVMMVMKISPLENNGYRLAMYMPFNYYPSVERYYIGFPPIYVGMDFGIRNAVGTETLFATTALFRDVTVAPENIPNPQTADGAKTIALTLITLTALATVCSKRLLCR